MAAGVQISDEVARQSLRRLVELSDIAERLRGSCSVARESQPGIWPQIDSVQGFAARYEAALQSVEGGLGSVQATIGNFRQALLDSNTALQRKDEEIQFQLQQLAERLDQPATPAPGAGVGSVNTLASLG
jgi:hypothetical protein